MWQLFSSDVLFVLHRVRKASNPDLKYGTELSGVHLRKAETWYCDTLYMYLSITIYYYIFIISTFINLLTSASMHLLISNIHICICAHVLKYTQSNFIQISLLYHKKDHLGLPSNKSILFSSK